MPAPWAMFKRTLPRSEPVALVTVWVLFAGLLPHLLSFPVLTSSAGNHPRQVRCLVSPSEPERFPPSREKSCGRTERERALSAKGERLRWQRDPV